MIKKQTCHAILLFTEREGWKGERDRSERETGVKETDRERETGGRKRESLQKQHVSLQVVKIL